MSEEHRIAGGHGEGRSDALTREASTVFERFVDGTVGLALVSFVLACASVPKLIPIDATVGPATVATLYGVALILVGTSLLCIGVLSRADIVATTPDASAGLGPGIAFGLVGLVLGAILGVGLLGGGSLWVVTALLTGAVFAAGTVLPREDLGSTIPPAVLTVVAGVAFAIGLIGVGWQWDPAIVDGGFTATAVVPLTVAFCSLLCSWAAGKARGNFGARGRQEGAYLLVYVTTGLILAAMVSIVLYVTVRGAPYAFRGFGVTSHFPFLEWPFVMRPYIPLSDKISGILPAIVGTAWLVVGASLFAVPLGVGAAVFLTEYAEEGRFTQVVEVATNALWSTPSVVYGLFGAAFLIPRISGEESLVSGMLVLGFMLLPLVLITSREAIIAVPDEYRDASAALGVSKWETVRSVVLPAAMPGVVTGIILGIGRIAGETAPLILVLGSPLNSINAALVPNMLNSQATLPTQIWAIIAAGVSGSTEKGWATAFVLLLVVLVFYGIGIASRTYFRRKLHYE